MPGFDVVYMLLHISHLDVHLVIILFQVFKPMY